MIALNKLSPFSRGKPHFERRPLPISLSYDRKKKGIVDRSMDTVADLLGNYVFFGTEKRLCLYFLFSTVLAFLGRLLEPLPKFYLTQKRNLINDFVVKMGLFWTSALLLPFIFASSKVYSGSNYCNICRQMSRMLVSFLLWLAVTHFISKVEQATGICSLTDYDDRSKCLGNGGHWFAFEISGHCFLLAYSSLVMAEELMVFRDWNLIPRVLDLRPFSLVTGVLNKWDLAVFDHYKLWTPVVRSLFIASSLLLLLWDFMLVISNLYYHTWIQNMTGLAFAGFCWYVTYGIWYRTPISFGMPGQSKLKQRIDFVYKED